LLLVMRQGLTIVAVGLVLGVGVAMATGRLVTKLLFNVTPTDTQTYMSVVILILATAAVACFLPSRRALRADPAQVFRGG
jgi:ABC-type antimicrobial peptide transport system permease subunit